MRREEEEECEKCLSFVFSYYTSFLVIFFCNNEHNDFVDTPSNRAAFPNRQQDHDCWRKLHITLSVFYYGLFAKYPWTFSSYRQPHLVSNFSSQQWSVILFWVVSYRCISCCCSRPVLGGYQHWCLFNRLNYKCLSIWQTYMQFTNFDEYFFPFTPTPKFY